MSQSKSSPPDRRWKAVDGILYRRFDDSFVVYNDLSGDTHQLDAMTMTLLQLLISAPLNQQGLVAAMQDLLQAETTDEGEHVKWVGDRMRVFQELSLIEAVPE